MIPKKVLSLDMSTKTGWAFITSCDEGAILHKFGKIDQIHEPKQVPYPASFVDWAEACFSKILELIQLYQPEILVIEETAAGSKSIFSQKILEFIHFLVANHIKQTHIPVLYLMTEQWRRETGCLMSKEESKRNKEVRDYKKKNKTNLAYDINGKRIGKITRKHINVRRANEVFGSFFDKPLIRAQEDMADAMLLGYAYHLRRVKNEKLEL